MSESGLCLWLPFCPHKTLYNIRALESLIPSKTWTHRVSTQNGKSRNIVVIIRGFKSWLHTSNSVQWAPFLLFSHEHLSSLFCTHLYDEDYGAHLAGFRGFMRKCKPGAFLPLLLILKGYQNFSLHDCQQSVLNKCKHEHSINMWHRGRPWRLFSSPKLLCKLSIIKISNINDEGSCPFQIR